MEKKVSFIIDSAKFKQNLYSPVSHLEIKSPEILNISKVKLIIVIAGSYNSEIETFIKKIILVNLELKNLRKLKFLSLVALVFLGSEYQIPIAKHEL